MFNFRSAIAAILASLFLFPAVPSAGWDSIGTFEKVIGVCGDPCVIKANMGGDVAQFQSAADAVNSGYKKLVVINGPCYSACTIFADKARAHVCVGPRVQFGFHQTAFTLNKADGTPLISFPIGMYYSKAIPPNSQDIIDWVNNHGGFPIQGLLMMGQSQASKFWQKCPLSVLR